MMKKKKVLHILNTGSYSGAENVVITIINNSSECVDSVYLSKEGSIREILKENNICFYAINRLSFFELRRAIKEIKPDIIHAHDFTASIMSVITNIKIPVISHIHNNSPWLKRYNIKSFLYAISTVRYQRILTVSKAVMDEFVLSHLCKKKVNVVGNPIDLKKIKNKVINKNCCESYDIAFLGRLSVPKNPLFFIDIIFALKNNIGDIKVKMIGDGELREQVEEKLDELDLRENVELLGFQSNPYEYLYQAKILCMPSVWEGFGLAAVEALALGKPVVAASVGGLVDIVDNSCGKLCFDKTDYINEITTLLDNTTLYEKKNKNAFIRAKELDNISRYIERITKLYSEL